MHFLEFLIVFRLVKRFDELHLEHIQPVASVTLGRDTLLCNKFLSIKYFRLSVFMSSGKVHLELRVLVRTEVGKIIAPSFRDELDRSIVAQCE